MKHSQIQLNSQQLQFAHDKQDVFSFFNNSICIRYMLVHYKAGKVT